MRLTREQVRRWRDELGSRVAGLWRDYGMLWLLTASVIAAGLCIGMRGELQMYRRLMAESSQTQGVVTSIGAHSLARYRYVVDSLGYARVDKADHPVSVGSSVTVWYAPSAPNESSLREPRGAFWNEVAFIVSAALLIPSLIAVFGVLRRNARPE